MTHAHLEALRDQLAAVIRDQAPLPISTDRVAELATGKPHGWTIYRHLRILENRGLIGRLRIPNDTRAFWHWIAAADDFDFTTADLEQRHPDSHGKRGTP